MDYYKSCDTVHQIQVVWSDQLNQPPISWNTRYSKDKYIIEMHSTDSLNNRFIPLQPIDTEVC